MNEDQLRSEIKKLLGAAEDRPLYPSLSNQLTDLAVRFAREQLKQIPIGKDPIVQNKLIQDRIKALGEPEKKGSPQ